MQPAKPANDTRTGEAWSGFAGAVLLVAGVAFLCVPVLAAVVAGAWLALTLLVLGAALAIGAIATRPAGWGWTLTRGALAVLVGAMLWRDPAAGVVGLALALGVYLAAAGATRVGIALAWRPGSGWAAMLASGLLGIVLAALVLVGWPLHSLAFVGTLLGLEACVEGVAHIAAGFRWSVPREPIAR